MQLTTSTLGMIEAKAGGIIRTGPFGSQLHESDYVEHGIPVVMPKNIIDGKISTEGIASISEDFAQKFSAHQLQQGDIVYGRRGDIGRRALVTSKENGWICGTGCLRISLGETILEPRFLYYYLGQLEIINWIANHAIGSTLPNLNTSILRSVPIVYPSLPTQRKISSILSAYDDLIENNTRRIAILEEMAQSLYQEWFVHFRFPGHEKKRMVESQMGLIPERWEFKTVGELLDYHIGGGWGQERGNEQFVEEAYVIRGTDIPSARYVSIDTCPLRYHKESNLKSRRLQPKDVVFEVSGGSKGQPVGRALFVSPQLLKAFSKDVICASFCKLLRINHSVISPEIFYFHLLEIYKSGHIEKYQVQSTGITNFKFEYFLNNENLLVPDLKLQEKFEELIEPIMASIQNLGARNVNLRRTRDLLLPKLISDEIDVERLDIEVDEEVSREVLGVS